MIGYVDEASNKTVVLGTVPAPMADYSPFWLMAQPSGIWQIVAYDASADLMPRTHDGYCIVDAVTGEVLPIPPS